MHNLQCDLPCAQVVRLLRQAVRSVHGHGAAPFTRLPSLVKDPEHPNVLYNRTPVPQQGDQETKTTPGSSEQAIW